MQNVLDRVPPDAWPLVDRLIQISVGVAALWLALSIFIYWRRRAANLTPVTAPRPNKKAQPDFLNVDHEARAAAIARGEAYERKLEEREAAEARAAAGLDTAMSAGRFARLASLVTSVFTLLMMIMGSILNVGKMGELMQQYSTGERIAAVVRNHPIGTAVIAVVVGAALFQYFNERRWRPEPKER